MWLLYRPAYLVNKYAAIFKSFETVNHWDKLKHLLSFLWHPVHISNGLLWGTRGTTLVIIITIIKTPPEIICLFETSELITNSSLIKWKCVRTVLFSHTHWQPIGIFINSTINNIRIIFRRPVLQSTIKVFPQSYILRVTLWVFRYGKLRCKRVQSEEP